jgi:hypothetical protein
VGVSILADRLERTQRRQVRTVSWYNDPDESPRRDPAGRSRRLAARSHAGSHRQFNHAAKRGVVTIPGKPNDELAPGTLNSIFKQAGLK